MIETRQLGIDGELIIANFLEKKNFKILAKNYRTKYGEIDLIAQKGELIVFVEVKTRKTRYFPISTVVTTRKQKKIIKTAKFFILSNNVIDKVCRFDIATIVQYSSGHEIEYIENAFFARH
ncbi:YraN family protein [Candidatus Babeliales bacterium]|nr:YraN family protein [Candidatus Babeliales bacterium]